MAEIVLVMEADVSRYVDVFPAQYVVTVFVAVEVCLSRFALLLEVDESLVEDDAFKLGTDEGLGHFGAAQVVVLTQVEVAYEVEVHVEVLVETVRVTVHLPLPLLVIHVVLDGTSTVLIWVCVLVASDDVVELVAVALVVEMVVDVAVVD